MLRFVYIVQAGERNFFTSFSQKLGRILYPIPVDQFKLMTAGVQKPEDFVGILYGWSLACHATNDKRARRGHPTICVESGARSIPIP